jgi:hypothetical protein
MTLLATLFGGTGAALFAHWLTIGRDRISARRAASAKFRATVLTALNGLYPLPMKWEKDMDAPLRAIFPALQTAVAEYRPFCALVVSSRI